ncbi:MAG: sulfurtransferase [Lautropia sp.]
MTSGPRRLLAAALLAIAAHASHAQSLIVDTPQVRKALDEGAIVWDARSAKDYAEGHLPGAVNFGAAGELFRDPIREDPPSAAVASQLFGQAGIDFLNRDVIVYTRNGDPIAHFAARMLEYYGGRFGKVYHGGIDAWKAAGHSLETQATRLPPVALNLSVSGAGAVSTKEVVALAQQGGAQLIDVRTKKEFTGEDVRAIRGGHITGAVNIPYEANWRDPLTAAKLASKQAKNRDGMSLKPEDELKALYATLDPAKETIVYCQSGVRASETAAVLRDLGFANVKVYESSWLGYAGVLSAPAQDEVFVNVGALNATIASLRNRVQSLEAEVGKLGSRPAQ